MDRKQQRDIEKAYPVTAFTAKLRRLADALEQGRPFVIRIGGERICVPARAVCTVEHEREGSNEEVEFQIRWSNTHGKNT